MLKHLDEPAWIVRHPARRPARVLLHRLGSLKRPRGEGAQRRPCSACSGRRGANQTYDGGAMSR